MIRLRHTDEWVGLLVVMAVVAFLGAVLQAGVLRDWFRPVSTLRIILPESGTGGLAVGAAVEVLGTRAGTIQRIVIDPRQQIYAEAVIDDQARAFIRRDSQAVIRKQFGVAGAGFVDISRGTGEGLDWTYAVIDAVTERAPTDSIGALIDEAREKIFPILDNAVRTTKAVAELAEGLQRGDGDIGRLLTDQTLVHAAENSVASLQRSLKEVEAAVADAKAVTAAASSRDQGVPELLHRMDAILVSLQASLREIGRAAPHVPTILRNVEGGTANLPSLLTQTQATEQQLEDLIAQLRGLWLLGGGGAPPPEPRRLPAGQVRP